MQYFRNYNCSKSSYDVNDFILPATENSAISITTRMIETEHVLRFCDDTTVRKKQNKYSPMYFAALHECYEKARCILPPFHRLQYTNETNFTIPQLCWFRLPKTHTKRNYQALDYILLIRNYVEFPQLHFKIDNVAIDNVTKNYTDNCEYDPIDHPLCPKFRILKILQMIENNTDEYELMFHNGSLIEIKISWKCNLDRPVKICRPLYQFQRLDYKPYKENPYQSGSNFLTSRHFFQPNSRQLHRVHTNIYNLHILVSVTGEVGKFDLFQTTTSIGSFLGIFGTGTIACDLIAAFFTNFKSVKYDR
jgi:hypothetical protein